MDYISYSKKINASYICPPKRNKLLEQRQLKSYFSGKYGLRPATHISDGLTGGLLNGGFHIWPAANFEIFEMVRNVVH